MFQEILVKSVAEIASHSSPKDLILGCYSNLFSLSHTNCQHELGIDSQINHINLLIGWIDAPTMDGRMNKWIMDGLMYSGWMDKLMDGVDWNQMK